ncbi:MAG: hypothetical protein SFZ24_01845 [Planctomycetota bacterium]|nr:hypothetical protein [Planctomycetota bacterium]
MIRTAMTVAAIAAISGSAMAQTITGAGGNATFAYNAGATPTSPTASAVSGSANLDANGAAAGGDSLFATWWHYRVDNDTREFTYHAPANPFVAAGDTMTATFNLPSAAPSFRSELRYQISDPDGAGTATALLQQYNRITNTSSTTRVLNVFSYADFDPNGSFSHPYSYDAGRQAFTGASGPVTFFYKGFGANAYQANDFSTLRGLLEDAAVTNLNNTVDGPGQSGTGDFTGAFQWTLTLAPGQSIELLSVLSLNTEPVPAPGALALVGVAGLAGLRRRR